MEKMKKELEKLKIENAELKRGTPKLKVHRKPQSVGTKLKPSIREKVENYEAFMSVPAPKYGVLRSALKGSTKSFWIDVVSDDPLKQMTYSRPSIEKILTTQLKKMEYYK
jgi:hypothetical protein